MSRPFKQCIVVYRGSLERSRLAFILDALTQPHEQVVFVWVYPGKLTEKVQGIFNEFIKVYDFSEVHVLNHSIQQLLKTRRSLSRLRQAYSHYNLALIGDSASLLAPSFKPSKTWWFINGIPEEASMHNTLHSKFQSQLRWWLYTLGIRPDLIITVSSRMAAYVSGHFPDVPIEAMPTCVDAATFSFSDIPQPRQNGLFVYLGTGAPWQALDKLSALWRAIHQQDKAIRFRVISRDPRCTVLSQGIASTHIEFMQSNDFSVVASYLHEAEVGFLIREDNIVNRVSFPTKFAEYLTAGCWVVASGLDWDITEYLDKYNVGFKASPDLPVDELARSILKYRASIKGNELTERIASCAAVLDRKYWIDKLISSIQTNSQ